MKINYTLIDESNMADFEPVLPKRFEFHDNRATIGAYDDGGYVLGAISYAIMGFEYEIDWLYVHPLARRNGVGLGLVDQVIKAVFGTGDLYPVTASFETSDEDNALHSFFLSCDSLTTEYSHERFYVTPEDIRRISLPHNAGNAQMKSVLFFDKPMEEQKKILAYLDYEDIYSVVNYEKWKQRCIPELCRCIYVKNNLLDLIFMCKMPDGNIELSYLYGKYPKGLISLLGGIASDMALFFPEVSLIFDAMSDESLSLAEHLFPKARKVHVYEAGL